MTEKEEKRLRHILARFEGVKHSSVEIVCAESPTNGRRRVYAKIRGFQYGYIFENERVAGSWKCVYEV